jgi:hypothetical protein
MHESIFTHDCRTVRLLVFRRAEVRQLIEGIRAPDFLQTTRAFSGPHSVRHDGDADAGLLVQQFHPLQFFQHFNLMRHDGDADAGLLVQQFHPLQFFQHFNLT